MIRTQAERAQRLIGMDERAHVGALSHGFPAVELRHRSIRIELQADLTAVVCARPRFKEAAAYPDSPLMRVGRVLLRARKRFLIFRAQSVQHLRDRVAVHLVAVSKLISGPKRVEIAEFKRIHVQRQRHLVHDLLRRKIDLDHAVTAVWGLERMIGKYGLSQVP